LLGFSSSPGLRICGPENHRTGFVEPVVEVESRVSIVLEIEIRDSEATLKNIEVKIRGKRTIRS
jgi:hypothetical protein